MMNWTSANNSFNYTFDTDSTAETIDITLPSPDPLIDWLPNSCLYTKYVPTWHLVRSYR